jgi:hypothetical protein
VRGFTEERWKAFAEEFVDLMLARRFARRAEFAKLLAHLIGFEVDALDLIIEAAAFDGAPLDDTIGGGTQRIAHVGLLENFFLAGAGSASGEELLASKTVPWARLMVSTKPSWTASTMVTR